MWRFLSEIYSNKCVASRPPMTTGLGLQLYVYWRTFLRVQHGELQDKTNTNKTLKHATKQ